MVYKLSLVPFPGECHAGHLDGVESISRHGAPESAESIHKFVDGQALPSGFNHN